MFLTTFATLVFQIVQVRILSVIAWYYLAFAAISVAMLGMTVGSLWVYLARERLGGEGLARDLTRSATAFALSLPLSLFLQLSLVTSIASSLTTVAAWSYLVLAMTVPYVFSGIVVSLALTRSPFPVGRVYGVDLGGAALGCLAVVGLLEVVDPCSLVLACGAVAAGGAILFARSAPAGAGPAPARGFLERPVRIGAALAVLAAVNGSLPTPFRPVVVKDELELRRGRPLRAVELPTRGSWPADPPPKPPYFWGASPATPRLPLIQQLHLNIDGAAGTVMCHYDGTRESIDFLRWDITNLAYRLPGIRHAAIIGVGGGRDILSAHLFGVPSITGVELNRIFVDLHTEHPFYRDFTNLQALPDLELHVDDARSWFASAGRRFDLIQMSMADTWAATGAGAYSLSENGLYTLEGWEAFLGSLSDRGRFTVSRWYSPDDVNETGRMLSLAAAALHRTGAAAPRRHLLVARVDRIATLVLSREPFSEEDLDRLEDVARGAPVRDPPVAPAAAGLGDPGADPRRAGRRRDRCGGGRPSTWTSRSPPTTGPSSSTSCGSPASPRCSGGSRSARRIAG